MNLDDLRAEIDKIDSVIIHSLGKRQKLIIKVAEYKKAHSLPPLQEARFTAILDRLIEAGKSENISPKLVTDIWEAIHEDSLNTQEKLV